MYNPPPRMKFTVPPKGEEEKIEEEELAIIRTEDPPTPQLVGINLPEKRQAP